VTAVEWRGAPPGEYYSANVGGRYVGYVRAAVTDWIAVVRDGGGRSWIAHGHCSEADAKTWAEERAVKHVQI